LGEAVRSSLNGAGLSPTNRQKAITESERLRAQREADKTAIRDRFESEFGSGQVDVRIRVEGGITDSDISSRGNVGTSLEILP